MTNLTWTKAMVQYICRINERRFEIMSNLKVSRPTPTDAEKAEVEWINIRMRLMDRANRLRERGESYAKTHNAD